MKVEYDLILLLFSLQGSTFEFLRIAFGLEIKYNVWRKT